MELRNRKGVYYVDAESYDMQTRKRKRVPRSTGVKVDGTKATERRARIIAQQKALEVVLTDKQRTFKVSDAYMANRRVKEAKNVAPATLAILDQKWVHVEKHFGADALLHVLDDASFVSYVAARKAAEMTPGTVLRELKELSMGMRALGLTPPKLPDVGKLRRGSHALSPAQSAALINALNPRWRDHVKVYRMTGIRLDELALLRREHVDTVGEVVWLTVPGSGSAGGDEPRTFPCHPALRPVFVRKLAEAVDGGPLFEEWTNAHRDLAAAGEKAGIEQRVSFNVLRSSFATELLKAGVPTRHVAELLGHKTSRMVEEVYAKLRAGTHLEGAIVKLTGYDSSEE